MRASPCPLLLLLLPLLAGADPDPVAAAVAGDAAAATPPPAIAAWTGLTIDAALAALPPTTPVLLELYAHWCPACQRFAPQYEAAAAAVAGSGIVVARVDCADEGALCNRYGVRAYPTVRLGTAATLADGKRYKEAALYDGAHDGAAVAAWARAEAAKLAGKEGAGGGTPATADTAALPAPVSGRGRGRGEGERGGDSFAPVLLTSPSLPPPPLRPPTSPTSTKPPCSPLPTPWTRARPWRSREAAPRCALSRPCPPARTRCPRAGRARPAL